MEDEEREGWRLGLRVMMPVKGSYGTRGAGPGLTSHGIPVSEYPRMVKRVQVGDGTFTTTISVTSLSCVRPVPGYPGTRVQFVEGIWVIGSARPGPGPECATNQPLRFRNGCR
eukprot:3940322-Rhodomonas_salina.1